MESLRGTQRGLLQEKHMYFTSEYIQRVLSSVWPGWTVSRELGRGSYGSVYEICRDNDTTGGYLDHTLTCALKVLYMEAEQSQEAGRMDMRTGLSDGTDLLFNPVSDSMIEDFVDNVSSEINMMIMMKGHPHIVSIEDYAVLRQERSCMILIRMEKLEPLSEYISRKGSLTRQDVIRLGSEICQALEYCEQKQVIHRDIKPGNLFYSGKTGFKLGDFGISRTMDSIYERSSMTSIGTPKYIAPEIFQGEEYNNTADLYSLGIVLYEKLNNDRMPLSSPDREHSDAAERNIFFRRMSGEAFPMPAAADSALGKVVLRACAFRPQERFGTAREFREALESCCGETDTGDFPYRRKKTASEGVSGDFFNQEDPFGGEDPGRRPDIPLIAGALAAGLLLILLCIKVLPGILHPTVEYTVILKEESGELILEKTLEGQSGSEITYTAPKLKGYTLLDDETMTLRLSKEADSNILVFTYSIDGIQENSPEPASTAKETSGTVTEKGAAVTTEAETTITTTVHVTAVPKTETEPPKQETSKTVTMAESKTVYPPESLSYGGHHYYIYNDVETVWEDALDKCLNRGGYLAVINDADENEELYRYMLNMGYDQAFFGLIQGDDEGSWEYLQGDSSSFRDWGINSKGVLEPNGSDGKEPHAELDINMRDGHWNDAGFGRQTYTPEGKKYNNIHAYICEWED